jgi:hypothetical protein
MSDSVPFLDAHLADRMPNGNTPGSILDFRVLFTGGFHFLAPGLRSDYHRSPTFDLQIAVIGNVFSWSCPDTAKPQFRPAALARQGAIIGKTGEKVNWALDQKRGQTVIPDW